MSGSSVFISRIRGLPVVDTDGDQIGKLRDVVVGFRPGVQAPRVRGLVVELFARQRIFVPMLRVHSVDAVQVVISGVVNTRRFSRRDAETLVVDDLVDQPVRRRGHPGPQVVYDVSMREVRNREWELAEVAVRERSGGRFRRRSHVTIVDWRDVVVGVQQTGQETEQLVARMEDMKPADIARELHDLSPARRADVVRALSDEVLADALGELPEDEQVELISSLETERAADVLEEMDADDAADLIGELAPDLAERLLGEMETEDAEDVRRLLSYEESTAGGLMTPEPVIVATGATVSEALALVRAEDLTPALASMVYVCRSPYETPTGPFVGGVHFQRLLREPPSTLVSALVDSDLEPLKASSTLAEVSRYFATYNLVCAPVVDPDNHLLGAVTVDDVLDHMLPEDWRGDQMDGMTPVDDEVAPAGPAGGRATDGQRDRLG
ncbi:magnesium transporter MgtE N-terminal domain-containing protein [Desertihabitans aurantiacus]|uniref:magnesium transporter MgtE N-terminal domain-containing protein n=1 Tax=Desertihabitans aurantiacus TaxID=2282477 RepID=UPI000DF7C5E5|nr:CBS domain-containing protein [Desertihabitans aurantiacus]